MEELPIELEEYQDYLHYVVEDINYTPQIRDVIFALAMSTNNIEVLRECLKRNVSDISYLYSKNLYETRIKNFNVNNKGLWKTTYVLKKNLDPYNSNSINNLKDIILGLSTDYTKGDEIYFSKIPDVGGGRSMIDGYYIVKVMFATFIEGISKGFFGLQDVKNIKELNSVVGQVLLDNYQLIIDTDRYKNFDIFTQRLFENFVLNVSHYDDFTYIRQIVDKLNDYYEEKSMFHPYITYFTRFEDSFVVADAFRFLFEMMKQDKFDLDKLTMDDFISWYDENKNEKFRVLRLNAF